VFPPTAENAARLAALHGLPVVEWRRSVWFTVDVEANQLREFPPRATAYVLSPNDPTGTLLGNQDLVRLTRACELVVVDERHVEYSGRSLLPFVREFENLVVLRTLETWAGLSGLPVAYAIASPSLGADLAPFRRASGVPTAPVLAALATLDDLAYVRATVERVREERARLYRMLRKLNVLTPYPSAANFVLARIERGDVESILPELARRGIQVHRPADPRLHDCLRISAGSPEATVALKHALVEIAVEL
jgi:histidinol-phosphate aminotransferase